MRKIILYVLSLLPMAVLAQGAQYESLLDEGKTWTIRIIGSNLYQTISYLEYKFSGDTIIDGISYKQLYSREQVDGMNGEWRKHRGEYIGEDEQGVVYYHNETYGSHYAIMDFSLMPGDTFYPIPEFFESIVTAVSDTILENSTDKKPHKCIHLSHISNGEVVPGGLSDIWIEGIGSVTVGPLGMHGMNMGGGKPNLMKCMQGETVIYEYNDATGVANTVKGITNNNDVYYDLAGRMLANPPMRKGVYIRNGRKYIMN